MRVALETTPEENIASIRDSVRAAKQKGFEVLLDCEHFFDGYKANPEFALACAKAAYDEGARWVVLCDTNGGTLPHEAEAIVGEVVKHIPGDHVGIHAHNDTEQAVAISLAAVRAGARQIQGTLNGLGERCGNANLVSIIPTLKLKPEYADRFDIGVSDDKLKTLAHASHTLDEMLNRAPNRHAPYVGESAFATKAGIHASAIMKDPATYEHVPPSTVGNRRKLLVSDQAGRSNVLAELDRIGLKVDKDDVRVGRLLDVVKEREAIGYAYEAADASFELLARRVMGQVPNYFDVTQFDVERRTARRRQGRARDRLSGGGEGQGRRRKPDLGGRRQRPGERARPRAAQGPRQVPELHQRARTHRLPRAYPQRRHRGGDARADREPGRDRRALDHGRGLAQHHRCVVPGADGFDRLQAGEGGSAGVSRDLLACGCTRRSLIAVAASAWAVVAARAEAAAPDQHRAFVAAAFRMKDEAIRRGDQAYGAVVVKDGLIVGDGPSRVVLKNDPTAHAEREAIRDAQARLGNPDLSGCLLYSTSRACPMCERNAAEANIARMFYGTDASDAGSPRHT